ncbi:helicase domain protein [Nitzschia inconspicua]|uniref:Helicase domain protein n=1 Tax=Nitzschia inconspicua TaxID=303405 RepID=A0A9K3K9A1_9STRA|nr:helicase domain protein [Nitzschia inconspicua]KAG7340426.1 helicase domain protein [Nitzschia inconspicua]
MNRNTERILDLLQCAEDVSRGIKSKNSPPKEDDTRGFTILDFEPLPIGPNGIEKVVARIPPISWDCSSIPPELCSAFCKAEIPVANSIRCEQTLTPLFVEDQQQPQELHCNLAVHAMQSPNLHRLPNLPDIILDACMHLPLTESANVVSSSTSAVLNEINAHLVKERYRNYQTGQWNERFKELMEFRACHGHLLVPHNYSPNKKLAQWVKRQRYQYKLKHEGKHSTLSDEREELLSQEGFIWGSHAACWQEHFQSLESFFTTHGHCFVPTDYKRDPSLAVWCKHQRRQLKLFREGKTGTMTEERYRCLQSIGFDGNPRSKAL